MAGSLPPAAHPPRFRRGGRLGAPRVGATDPGVARCGALLRGRVAGVGLMAGRGFWSTYTWEHIAAQAGMMLFDENWEPVFN
ncbi:MAG: hypothetical protein P1P87_08030, partial [Trueperaceae bacterium]|nr:hypothetical protein [Trueperaceae bacterium]